MTTESKQKTIQIGETVTVKALADLLQVPITTLIGLLLKNGITATVNESLDYETAAIIAEEFGTTAVLAKMATSKAEISVEEVRNRPPVVAIMGHVDHGKTTLLDAILKTNVVASESGGITQHITAYQVTHTSPKNKHKAIITFIDTPGHSAFTAMRRHGAAITDVVVLVVAADDGVKPQTIEAIDHATLAHVPIIVAITKTDQPGANIDRIKQQLAEMDLVPEEWGGKTIVVPVSAKLKTGLDQLLETILLVAEMQNLKASYAGKASGVVIESHLQPGKGPTATVLMQNGVLKLGEPVAVGKIFGKVRQMTDYAGKQIDQALPSQPVIVSGFKGMPDFGETLVAVNSEKEAKETSARYSRETQVGKVHSMVKSGLAESVSEELIERKELPLIIKADVKGSLEAIKKVLEETGTEEVRVNVIQSGVGDVAESDVTYAKAAKALVIAFRVSASSQIRALADHEKVKISSYDVIYELIEDVKQALSKLLPPEVVQVSVGKATVVQLFKGNTKSQVVGVRIEEGKITSGDQFRLLRKDTISGEGKIMAVHRGKDAVKEALAGSEAGLQIPGRVEVQVGDLLESFYTETRTRTL